MSWIWAALMPHPPVIVPEVGKGREKEAEATLKGTEALLDRLRELGDERTPDVLLVLSPHLPYAPGAVFINAAPRLAGSLVRFGAPGAALTAFTPAEALAELTAAVQAGGIPHGIGEFPDITQDHGAIVPLLNLAGGFPDNALPPLIMANPAGLSPEHALAFGDCLRTLAGPRRWALLASGDLSHRLTPGAPSGFSPDGAIFDRVVVASLKAGDPAPLLALPPRVRENAGECGLRPVLVLLRLARAPLQVLSYEGPFGVGYCNAFWRPGQSRISVSVAPARKQARHQARHQAQHQAGQPAGQQRAGGHPYAALARQTVAALLRGGEPPTKAAIDALAPDASLWSPQKGCFVSIKTIDGSLRGCIGTFLPTQPGLAEEIMTNAVSAATRDPRFPPMRVEELQTVRFSVDVLNTPERLQGGMGLDPAVYGVIVSKNGRRGLLLPDLPGVTRVEQQLAIAAHKGGISSLEGADIFRFTVSRHTEADDREGKE